MDVLNQLPIYDIKFFTRRRQLVAPTKEAQVRTRIIRKPFLTTKLQGVGPLITS